MTRRSKRHDRPLLSSYPAWHRPRRRPGQALRVAWRPAWTPGCGRHPPTAAGTGPEKRTPRPRSANLRSPHFRGIPGTTRAWPNHAKPDPPLNGQSPTRSTTSTLGHDWAQRRRSTEHRTRRLVHQSPPARTTLRHRHPGTRRLINEPSARASPQWSPLFTPQRREGPRPFNAQLLPVCAPALPPAPSFNAKSPFQLMMARFAER